MKAAPYLILFATALAATASAQRPGTPALPPTPAPLAAPPSAPAAAPAAAPPSAPTAALPGVRLDVRTIATSKQGHSSSTYYSGYWRDYLRTTRLEAEVGTFSTQPLPVKLEWYFVGKQLGGGQRIIISRGDQDLTLKSGPSQRIQLASEPTRGVESLYHYYYYSSRYASGSKPEGWIVRIADTSGRTLALRGSSGGLTEFFRDPARLDELLKQAERDGKRD